MEENKVIFKCPAGLKNRYFGLRHGESEANKLGVISSDPDIGSRMHGLTALGRSQARLAASELLRQVDRDTVDPSTLVFVSSHFRRARETAEQCIQAVQSALAIERAPRVTSASFDPKETDLFILKMVLTHLGDKTICDPESPLLSALVEDNIQLITKELFYRLTDLSSANASPADKHRYGALIDSLLSYIQGADPDNSRLLTTGLPNIQAYIQSSVQIPLLINEKLRERSFGDLDGKPLVTYNYVWPVDLVDGRNKRRGVDSVSEVVLRVLDLVIEMERTHSGKCIGNAARIDPLLLVSSPTL